MLTIQNAGTHYNLNDAVTSVCICMAFIWMHSMKMLKSERKQLPYIYNCTYTLHLCDERTAHIAFCTSNESAKQQQQQQQMTTPTTTTTRQRQPRMNWMVLISLQHYYLHSTHHIHSPPQNQLDCIPFIQSFSTSLYAFWCLNDFLWFIQLYFLFFEMHVLL